VDPPPKPRARGKKLSLCEVEAFEAYWNKFVGDDSAHDLSDIDSFFNGFNVEDELMHATCQMFRMRQIKTTINDDQHQYEYAIYSKRVEGATHIMSIEQSIERDAIKFEHHITIQGLSEVDDIARSRDWKADLLIIGAAFEALNKKLEKLGLPRKPPQYAEPVWKKQPNSEKSI
jgi:hypothetical protein